MGNDTLSIPMELFSENRQKLCDRLKARDDVKAGALVILQGGEQSQRYCTDTDVVFRQVAATCVCDYACSVSSYRSPISTGYLE